MTLTFGVGQSELPWGLGGTASDADVTRICQEIAALGATSVRMSCLWLQLDPNRSAHGNIDKYQWTNLDRAVDAAEAAGLDILLIVEPRRSVLPIGVSATLSLAQDYGLMCGAIATKYVGRIRWYEVANECNNLAFFGAPKTPSKYLTFLREAFNRITDADPAATVLAGALQAVGTGWPTLHPVEWVTKFYDSNPQDSFHGLSMHPYSTDGVFNPLTPTTGNEFAFKNIELIRAIMDANGDTAKKIFCTEWGYDSMRTLNGLSTTDPELEAEQAANLQTHWNILKTYEASGAIYDVTWPFMYRDWEQENKKAQNHFGFVHFDYTKKAAWTFLHSVAEPVPVTPPSASIPVQVWNPEVGIFIDPTSIRPTSVNIPVSAWNPEVITPVTATSVNVPVSVWNPEVGTITNVQYVSTGGGDRDITGGNDITLTWSHSFATVPGGLGLVGFVVSTENSKPWELYDILTVTTDTDGAWTRLGSRHLASSSNKEGSVHIFGKLNPTSGSTNFTARVKETDGVTIFDGVAANSVLYQGVLDTGLVYANGSSSGGNTPTVTATSAIDNMVFFVFGGSNDFNASFNKTVRHHAGSNLVEGNGDYILIGDAAGAASVTATASVGLTLYGALALDIKSL